MRVKCVKCNIVEELRKDEIEHLVNITKMYNEEISPAEYTTILSIIKGRCTGGKKHLYVYDDMFTKNIAGLIAEHNKLHDNIAIKEKELSDVLQKIESLTDEIQNLNKKRDDTIKEIGDINTTINNVMETFEKETGTRYINIWS
jgi:cell division protein FtsB